MEGLARAGNGTAEFVKEGERMQPKVGVLITSCVHVAQASVKAGLWSLDNDYGHGSLQTGSLLCFQGVHAIRHGEIV